jgi:hypothetical protein
MPKEVKESHKNLVRQEIIDKDGNKSSIFHRKYTHGNQFADFKSWWNDVNKMPKPNSKRQKLLAATKTETINQ